MSDSPHPNSNSPDGDVYDDPVLNGSVNFRISDGAFTASWSDEDADIRTTVNQNKLTGSGGKVRISVGASMDPQLASGTGLEIWMDKQEFMPLLIAAAKEWDDVTIQIDTDETDQHTD